MGADVTPREYKPGTGLDGLFKSADGKGRKADESDTLRVRRNVLKLADLLDLPKDSLERLHTPDALIARLYELAAQDISNPDPDTTEAAKTSDRKDHNDH
ncbi:hypothetical protein [Ruegeria sp. HKCCD8929]|uniref:hypothetical protein n=1 Tax=Ruegeria sp. HKCCD8929 TaxID=2683006 RepID=UPI00148A1145|nr:hypothetical protein [Ruegeria sp. HKCCD8929]